MKRTAFAAAAVTAALALAGCGSGEDIVSYVDPMVGTGGHGHTFPAASVPFGMMQLGPDTRLTGWDGCSAYHYSDDVVYGFSHTHLSGTGCSDYGDILVTATTGEPLLVRGEGDDTSNGYRSRFRHETERAEPGYYAVELDDYRIRAEMTVSARCGIHPFYVPRSHPDGLDVNVRALDEVAARGLEDWKITHFGGRHWEENVDSIRGEP